MKYGVVEYREYRMAGLIVPEDTKTLYAITADGKQIGLNLPASCESVELGREFLAWCDGEGRSIFGDKHECTKPYILKIRFDRFLEQREEAEEQPAEPEESTATSEGILSQYEIKGIRVDGSPFIIAIHKPSKKLIPYLFATGKENEPEGFLTWWHGKPTWMPGLSNGDVVAALAEYARYKAASEPQYVCPECGTEAKLWRFTGCDGFLQLECKNEDCSARSPKFEQGSRPDERWMGKPTVKTESEPGD